jgi:PAS domain S-box-containing protein
MDGSLMVQYGGAMPIKQESLKEKVYQAERNLAAIRLVIISFNSLIYLLFMQQRADTIPALAWLTIAIAMPYGLLVVLTEPYRRFPLMVSSYFTSIGDALLITIWLAGTGGFDSPFFPLWYASIAAIAFRFGMLETMLAASLYSLSYLGLMYVIEPVRPPLVSVITHIAYIYFVGSIGALLAQEFSKQISAKLQAEERYRHLFENAVVGIYRTSTDGHFVSSNAALAQLFGFEKPADLEVVSADGLYIDEKRRAQFKKAIESQGQVANFESEVRRKDGTAIWIAESSRAVRDDEGQITGYEGMIEDITARRQSEVMIQSHNRALIQANKELAVARRRAEDAARVKDEFLANMSHELRTPLNAIIGYSEIISAGIAGELTEKQNDNLKRILYNAEHLLKLINDILDLAKIEAGKVELVKTSFDLREWLDMIRLQMEGLAAEKNLSFKAEISATLPSVVVADSDRLKQIAVNLLSNAIKFTEEGEVSISLTALENERWSIVVKDTGMGIPQEARDYIFDEFRQVDGSSRRSHGGTGLGLAIVRNLVQMMEGTISVESEVDQGSTFTIILPLQTVESGIFSVDVMEKTN